MIRFALAGRVGSFALDVASELPAGVTALIGPSGAGKTTLLRALAGLVRLGGMVEADGEVWQDERRFVPAERRRIGYVFQGAGLLSHLSVGRNLAYATRRGGVGDAADIAALCGVAHLLDRSPASLSGGEAQRAQLARALVSRPRLLLLDEPLTGLDDESRADLIEALDRLLADLGIPVLLVTHNRAEAERLAARTLTMRGGRLER